MSDINNERMRNLRRLEQLDAGLRDSDKKSISRARKLLRELSAASPDMLRRVIHGLLLAEDEEQPEWDAENK